MATPTPVTVELYYDSTWHDVTSDVRVADGITITRGRSTGAQRVSPTQCSLAFNNHTAKYSPRNPNSALFGKIGRNTPIRVWTTKSETITEDFEDDTYNVTLTSTGTYARNSSFAQSGSSSGSIAPTANGGGATLDITVPTGATSVTFWYRRVTSACQLTVLLDGVADLTTTTSTDGAFVQYTADVTDVSTIRLQVVDSATAGIGAVRIDSLSFSGIRSYRFYGEVEAWPVRSQGAGKDIWTPIRAYGVTRRLGNAGTRSPALTAIHRFIDQNRAGVLGYWPMTDAVGSTGAAPYAGTVSLDVVPDTLTGDDGTIAVLPVWQAAQLAPHLGPGVQFERFGVTAATDNPDMAAELDAPSDAEAWAVDVVFRGLPTSTAPVIEITDPDNTDAPSLLVAVFTSDPPNIDVRLDDIPGATETFSGPFDVSDAFDNDQLHCLRIYATEAGGLFDWELFLDGVSQATGTSASRSLHRMGKVRIAGPGKTEVGVKVLIGHVIAWCGDAADIPSASDVWDAVQGNPGEEAHDRITRLASDLGLTNVGVDGTTSATLGPEPLAPILDIMFDAAEADGGVLVEARDQFRIDYNLFESLGVAPAAILDYDEEQVAGLDPVEDSDLLANKVTVKRRDGGESTVEKTSGWLNTQEPSDDAKGVGTYPVRYELNLEDDTTLADQAARRLRIGTWDEPRFEAVTVNVAKLRDDGEDSLVDDVLSVDVADGLAITNPPSWAGPQSVRLLVDGYTETIGSHTHVISFHGSPARPYQTVGLSLPGTSGNYASIADTAILDVTGDIDIRAEITLDDYTTGATQTIVGKYSTSGNQRSYRMYVNGSGNLSLAWSTDGTGTTVLTEAESLTSVVSDGERIAVRATLDVNNGASNYTVKFYTAPCIDGPWTRLGTADDTGSATTSIFAGTAALEVGSIAGGTGDLAAGTIHAVQVYNGIDGTKVVDVRFQEQVAGDTSFTDDGAGLTWTVHGTAAIV